MAKARQRLVVTGNVRFNYTTITGQRVILLGECTGNGVSKNAKPKKPYKRDLTHLRFRFEDKKWVRENKLKAFYEFTMRKDDAARFMEKVDA